MKAAIEYMGKLSGRKIAVLGDMLELGDFSKQLHEKVGMEVSKNNLDVLIVVGNDAKYIAQKVLEDGKITSKNIFMCDNNSDAIFKLKNIMKENDYILFKASNGMHFDEIINGLK